MTSRAACQLHYAIDSTVVGLVLSGGGGKKGLTPRRGDTAGDRWERNTQRGDVGGGVKSPPDDKKKKSQRGSQSFPSEFSIRAKGAAVWARRWEERQLSIRIMSLDKMHFAYVRPAPGEKLFRLRRI